CRQPDIYLERNHQPDIHHPLASGRNSHRSATTVTVRCGRLLACVRRQRRSARDHIVGLSGGTAWLDRRRLHGGPHRRTSVRRICAVTSAEPSSGATSTPASSGPDNALCAALATEHAVIYGYGIVSAHSPPDVNKLVAYAMNQHRERRDQVIVML